MIFSKEHRKNLSKAKLGNKNCVGRIPWNKGLKGVYTSKTKGTKRPEMSGEKHPNWKGGFDRQSYMKRYREKYREYIYYKNMQRHALKKNAEGSHTFLDWELLKAQNDFKCGGCGIVKLLTQDHIIPLSKGGTDYIWNIQPLCRSCNSKKHIQSIFYWVPQDKVLITKNYG